MLQWNWFSNLDQAADAISTARAEGLTIYLRPTSDQFPAVDAIAVLAGALILLQVTIKKSHPINGPGAKSVLSKLMKIAKDEGMYVGMFWVVAPSQFLNYPSQETSGTIIDQYCVTMRSNRMEEGKE